MYEQVENPKLNSSRSIAHSVAQKKSDGVQGFGFVDNRVEYNTQMKLQATANKYAYNNSCMSKTVNPIQMKVVESRSGKPGYWDAKKIQSKNMGTKWWQFKGAPGNPINQDFTTNELSFGTYTGSVIPISGYGQNAVIVNTNVESSKSGYMKMANNKLKALSSVSDGAVFDAATRLTGHKYKGTGNTWHHGARIGEMFLLASEIHSAFAPHVGWASQGGSRNEMRDFIVGNDVFD